MISVAVDPTVKYPSSKSIVLTRLCLTEFICRENSEVQAETVPGGQFKWGVSLLKSNGGVYKVPLARMEIALDA